MLPTSLEWNLYHELHELHEFTPSEMIQIRYNLFLRKDEHRRHESQECHEAIRGISEISGRI